MVVAFVALALLTLSGVRLATVMPPVRYPDTLQYERVIDGWLGRPLPVLPWGQVHYPGRGPAFGLLMKAAGALATPFGADPDRLLLVLQACLIPIGGWMYWRLLARLGLGPWARAAGLVVFLSWIEYWQYTHTVLNHPLANISLLAFVLAIVARRWTAAAAAGIAFGLTRPEGLGVVVVALLVAAGLERFSTGVPGAAFGQRAARPARRPAIALATVIAVFVGYYAVGTIRVRGFNLGDEQLAYNLTLTANHCGLDLRPKFPGWTPKRSRFGEAGYGLVLEEVQRGRTFHQIAVNARAILLAHPVTTLACMAARAPRIVFGLGDGLQEWASYGSVKGVDAQAWDVLRRLNLSLWFLVPAVALASIPFARPSTEHGRAAILLWLVIGLNLAVLFVLAAGVEELSRHRVHLDPLFLALASFAVVRVGRALRRRSS